MSSPTNSRCEMIFAGEQFVLDAEGALFWPSQSTLIVSDLHLEKASFFAQFGALLPRYDTRHTLQRLTQLIERYRPARVICLGDSFHDRNAFARLQADDRAGLLQLSLSLPEWHWVLGNHDPKLPADLPGQMHVMLEMKNIAFLHEPEDRPSPQIVGHFHPKLTLRLGGQRVSGPTFIHDDKLFILPSFGSFTGGLDIRHDTIAGLLDSPTRYLIYRQRIYKSLPAPSEPAE